MNKLKSSCSELPINNFVTITQENH